MRLEIDDLVVKEGELSREIYVVLDGSAEVYVKWTLPDRTRVGTVSKGAIFGEIEMLAHIDNPECELTHQPGPEFGRLLIECFAGSGPDPSADGQGGAGDELRLHPLRPAAADHVRAPVRPRPHPILLQEASAFRAREARLQRQAEALRHSAFLGLGSRQHGATGACDGGTAEGAALRHDGMELAAAGGRASRRAGASQKP